MSYGHQLVAAFGLAAFALLRWRPPNRLKLAGAGACAGFVSVVELQSAPISIVLGLYAVGLTIGKHIRFGDLAAFVLGALAPSLVLATYNLLAFGSPWDLGYFHLANEFVRVHSQENPLGFVGPQWNVAGQLLWGEYRGLLFYAPILGLAVPGWIALGMRGEWGVVLVSGAICAGVFLVNLSYPEWTGGWSTGPRMLVPLLPFGVLAVAGWAGSEFAQKPQTVRWVQTAIVILVVWGWVLMTLFQGIGAHVPQTETDPLMKAVWPMWRGDPLPPWATGGRFVRMPIIEWVVKLPETRGWLGLVPLVGLQALALGLIGRLRDWPILAEP